MKNYSVSVLTKIIHSNKNELSPPYIINAFTSETDLKPVKTHWTNS